MTDVAQRMARSRKRRKRGLLCLPIEVRRREREALVGMGFLAADKINDAAAAREAVHRMFDRLFSNIERFENAFQPS